MGAFLVIIFSLLGWYVAFESSIMTAASAPQQAAGAALALAICVPPYLMLKASHTRVLEKSQKEIIELLKSINDRNF